MSLLRFFSSRRWIFFLVWQELEKTLINFGVQTYSIFFDDETNELFGYAEIESLARWKKIANTKICQKWWDYMSPLMPCNEDNSPISKELKEVFYIKK